MSEFGDVVTWSPDRSQELEAAAMEVSAAVHPSTLEPMPGGRWDAALAAERCAFRTANS
jgi:hypothetical protein